MMETYKILTALVAGTLIVFSASAEPPRPTDSIYACLEISEDRERLACFDKEAAALKSSEDVGDVQTVDAKRVEAIEKESFGLSLPALGSLFGDGKRSSKVDNLVLPISRAYKLKNSGKIVVVMENGQIWKQIDSVRVSNNRIKNANEATVKRASLGSFMLSIDGATSFRASRER